MEKELWLYKLLLDDVSDARSFTGNALRLVCSLQGVNDCAIWLREHNGPSDRILLFKEGKCAYVSPDDAAFAVLRQYEPLEMNSKVACRFGRFYREKNTLELSQKARDAFSVFCEFLYSDYMMGFFETGAPVELNVKNIIMNYGNGKNSPNVLSDVSFVINRGQLTVLMGASGCGKSTMLNIMGGLLKPGSGSVCYKGMDVCGFNKRQLNHYRRNDVGFIFQNYNLLTDLTVGENVRIAQSLAADPANAKDVLDSVGVGHYAGEYPFHLSGGEQQRVCIARALVKNADILLCDEPTGALDTVNSKNIMTILQQKAKENNNAVVVVTHNPKFEALADHYIEMSNGEIIYDEYRPFPYSAEEYL